MCCEQVEKIVTIVGPLIDHVLCAMHEILLASALKQSHISTSYTQYSPRVMHNAQIDSFTHDIYTLQPHASASISCVGSLHVTPLRPRVFVDVEPFQLMQKLLHHVFMLMPSISRVESLPFL